MDSLEIAKNKFSWEICGSPYFLSLLVLYVSFNLLGTLLLHKLIVLGIGLAPGGLFVLPFVLLIEDVVAEVYGYKISRLLLWYIFLSMLVFTLASIFIIHLPSSSQNYNLSQNCYNIVFDPILKVTPSLILSLSCSRFINIYIITKMKIIWKGRFFWIRSIFSSTIGGLIGIIVAFVLTYGSILSSTGIEKLIVTDYLVRVLYAIIGGGPAWLIVIFLKKKEKVDIYDIGTNFNPFKLSVID